MDVFEYVDDDVGLLMQYVQGVLLGSWFLIMVFVFQFLWSGYDDFFEYKCRYMFGGFEGVVWCVGFDVEYGVYYFGFMFLFVVVLWLGEWVCLQLCEFVL